MACAMRSTFGASDPIRASVKRLDGPETLIDAVTSAPWSRTGTAMQ
jgi:hypothetical protein